MEMDTPPVSPQVPQPVLPEQELTHHLHTLAAVPVEDAPANDLLFKLDTAEIPKILTPRPATIPDVDGMSLLINEYASARIMLARGPLYLYQSIKDYKVMSVEQHGTERLVACGGLHVLWEDLAEVRSVAVHPDLQHKGYGRTMVEALIKDAKALGVHHLFTFTLSEGFFKRLGFETIERSTIPPVVWAECSKCPKFYKCDEIGMMLHI